MRVRALLWLASRASALVGTAMVAASLLALPPGIATAVGQQTREMKRVASLWDGTRQDAEELFRAFDDELASRGWRDGRTIHRIHGFNDYKGPEALDVLANQIVRSNPSVIVVVTDRVAAAIRRHTTTLPIVIIASADPVGTGWAASLARPGGNVTGLAAGPPVIWGKRLQIMKEAIPGLRRIGLVYNPDWPTHRPSFEALTEAATAHGLQLIAAPVRETAVVNAVIQALPSQGAQGLFVLTDNVTYPLRREIPALALSLRLPSAYGYRQFCDGGGLLCYAEDFVGLSRRSADYVDRILKGGDPATMPMEEPVKYELSINVGTAKKLGLTIPSAILGRTDKLIE
jgi:putative ABC transport system substrate-binding protein